MRLRPETIGATRCDAAGCRADYEVRYRAGADEHLARTRDLLFCDHHLELYGLELDRLRAARAITSAAAGAVELSTAP